MSLTKKGDSITLLNQTQNNNNRNPLASIPLAILKSFCTIVTLWLLFAPTSWAAVNYTVLHTFGNVDPSGNYLIAGPKGAQPYGELIQAPDGKLYGTTHNGGNNANGAIFSVDISGPNPVVTTVHHFELATEGGYPDTTLSLGKDGKLFGTTTGGGQFSKGTIFRFDITGATPVYTVLHNFDCTNCGGYGLHYDVIQGSDGNLYGTAISFNTYGIVFKLDLSGPTPVYSVLHTFNSSASDGWLPHGKLVELNTISKLICGTTESGGIFGALGTIFCFETYPAAGPVKKAYSFMPANDGGLPYAGLTVLKDSAGIDALYGVAYSGGGLINGLQSGGTIFKVKANPDPMVNNEAFAADVLHRFFHEPNSYQYLQGLAPYAPIMQAKDGKFYGTTLAGGVNNSGTIYQMAIDGTGFNVLHSFDIFEGRPNPLSTGSMPYNGIMQASDGNFYGLANRGGAYDVGVLYRLSLTGPTTTTLASSLNPAFFGQTIILSATVSGSSPTGTVTFKDGATTLGTAPITSGIASLATGSLSIGSHNLTAEYGGDSDDAASTSAILTQAINANTIPSAGNDAFTLAHIGLNPVTVPAPGIMANDNDNDGQTISVTGATNDAPRLITLTNNAGTASGGTVALYADGHFVYTPSAAGFTGTRSFTYQATDGINGSNLATVTLAIRRAPNAVNDTATTAVNQAVTVNVLANDKAFGASLDSSTVTVVAQSTHGAAAVNQDGTISYTPHQDFAGLDTFSYTVKDSLSAASNEAVVTVYVPQAVADQYTFTASTGATQTISRAAATGVLANDEPIGVRGRTVTLMSDIVRIDGTGIATLSPLTFNANGSFSFTLTAPTTATTGALRQASKRGSYQFSYTETLNGVTTAPVTARIVVQ